MKNIFKIFVLLFVVGCMSSCEPDEYAKPDIDLTPVYTISETGNNDMTEINIYKEESLITVWNKDGLVKSYTTSNYSDISDDTNFLVTVTAAENKTVTDDEGNESVVTISHAYELTGNKETGACGIAILTTDENNETSTLNISGTLIEEEVYY